MRLLKISALLILISAINLCYGQYDYSSGGGRRGQRNAEPEKPILTDIPTGYISLNGGLGIPLGNFANPPFPKYGNYGGNALPGGSFNISADLPLNHTNIGVALMLSSYSNQVNTGGYTSSFSASDSGQANSGIGTNFYSGQSDYYSTTTLMAGLFYTYPVGRISFDLRGMIGIAFCSLPDINFFATYQGNQSDTWEISGSNSTGFAYDLGAGIRYGLRRNSCIMLNIDYMGVNTSYNTTIEHDYYYTYSAVPTPGNYFTNYPASSNIAPVTGSLVMSMLTISFGVGWQFGAH